MSASTLPYRPFQRMLVFLVGLSVVAAATIVPSVSDAAPSVQPIAGDWNGDGRESPGVFADGLVTLWSATPTGGTLQFRYGRPGDVIVAGDWNGNGQDTIGIVRKGREWHVRKSNSAGAADLVFTYGGRFGTKRPVAGDWNGDGFDTPGVVQGRTWLLRNSLSGGRADVRFRFGRVNTGDIPVAADWSGQGKDLPGVVRKGVWHLRMVQAGGAADRSFKYGRADDLPVAGNWNGRGGATPGVMRDGDWLLRSRLSGGSADLVFASGADGPASATERQVTKADAPPRPAPTKKPAPAPTPVDDAKQDPGPGGEPAETEASEPVEAQAEEPDSGPEVEGRSGLLYSAEEVVLWRQRAQQGPYRVGGDVSANSPGDWSRIRRNADRFLADPSAARWAGPPQGDLSTCVQKGNGEPPTGGPSELRDAAFVALVSGEERFATAVKEELLRQASAPGTDFSNRSRWCTGVLFDVNPGFIITEWLAKLLMAYDYLGPEAFSARERAQLDGWFLEAARFFQVDLDASLSRLFADRGSSDQLSSSVLENPRCSGSYYLGSTTTCTLNRDYNNRRATIARFVGLVGVDQQDEVLKRSARLFTEEFLKYGVFPEGFVADYLRGSPEKPMLGWAYGANSVSSVLTIADAFARAGDPSLYEYTTSVGAFGSEGGQKSLLFAARSFGQHVDGTYLRYATDDPSHEGDSRYLIDGEAAGAGFLHDVAFAQANVYYQDSYLRQAYTRSGAGMNGYPSRIVSSGPHQIWTGGGGIFPGVLFMYGQTEGTVTPH